MRKHIHHAGCQQFEAMLVHQHAEIARQRGRMAGDIQQALRAPVARRAAAARAPRRAADRAARACSAAGSQGAALMSRAQIGAEELRIADAVAARVGARALDQAAHRPRRRRRCCARRASASEKLPSPQYRSSTRDSAVQLAAAAPARVDQRAIDRGIDLDEIGRQKLQLQLRLRQRVVQCRRRLRQARARCRCRPAADRNARRAAPRTRAVCSDPRPTARSSTRSTSATALSATATSICGSRSRIESCADQRRTAARSERRPVARAPRSARWHAIRFELRSRKPTSTRSLRVARTCTPRRARRR